MARTNQPSKEKYFLKNDRKRERYFHERAWETMKKSNNFWRRESNSMITKISFENKIFLWNVSYFFLL